MSDTIVTDIVVLNLPTKPADLLASSQNIATKMDPNKDIPLLTPTTAVLNGYNVTLDGAIKAAKTRVAGAVIARKKAVKDVKGALGQRKANVQLAVTNDPARALVIAVGCGMDLKDLTIASHAELEITQPKAYVSGMVHARRKDPGGETRSEWEHSIDGFKTTLNDDPTIACSTDIKNIPAGSSLVVRHRFLTRTGYLDWVQSQPFTVR